MRNYSALALAAVAFASTCQGKLILNSTAFDADQIDIGVTAPKRVTITRTSGKVSGELMLFGEEERETYCGKTYEEEEWGAIRGEFTGKIIILKGRYAGDSFTCWGGSKLHTSIEYLWYWCQLGTGVLVIEKWVPGLFSNDQDGVNYTTFKKSSLLHQRLSHECVFLEALESQETALLTETITKAKEANISLFADLTIDEPVCQPVFTSWVTQVWMRGILGTVHLFVSIASFIALFGTTRRKSNQFVSSVVLTVNCITMFVLALALFNGGWRISTGVSHAVSNFLLPAFVGSHGANDFLLALRWNEIKEESFISRKKTTQSPVAAFRKKLVLVIAFLLLALDLASSILFVHMTDSLQVIETLLPLIAAVMQIIALFYLTSQISRMITVLNKLKARMCNATNSTKMLSTLVLQHQLVRSLRFWGTVSVSASICSLCVLASFAVSQRYQESCYQWVLHWSALLTAQVFNCLAQTKFCSPVTNKNRIEPLDTY